MRKSSIYTGMPTCELDCLLQVDFFIHILQGRLVFWMNELFLSIHNIQPKDPQLTWQFDDLLQVDFLVPCSRRSFIVYTETKLEDIINGVQSAEYDNRLQPTPGHDDQWCFAAGWFLLWVCDPKIIWTQFLISNCNCEMQTVSVNRNSDRTIPCSYSFPIIADSV